MSKAETCSVVLRLCREPVLCCSGKVLVLKVLGSPSGRSCPSGTGRWSDLDLQPHHLSACFPPIGYLSERNIQRSTGNSKISIQSTPAENLSYYELILKNKKKLIKKTNQRTELGANVVKLNENNRWHFGSFSINHVAAPGKPEYNVDIKYVNGTNKRLASRILVKKKKIDICLLEWTWRSGTLTGVFAWAASRVLLANSFIPATNQYWPLTHRQRLW